MPAPKFKKYVTADRHAHPHGLQNFFGLQQAQHILRMLGHSGRAVSYFRTTMSTQVRQNELVARRQLGGRGCPELMMYRKRMDQNDGKTTTYRLVVKLNVIAKDVHKVVKGRARKRCRVVS